MSCAVCKLDTAGKATWDTSIGKVCDDCWKCTTCGVKLTGSYFAEDGKLYDSDCRAKLMGPKCVVCGEAVGGSKPGLVALDKNFHDDCFRCSTSSCNKALGTKFSTIDGNPYCSQDCVDKRDGREVKLCGGCGKEASGAWLTALDQTWHEECFVCSDCKGKLPEKFSVVDGKPYCKGDCARKNQAGGDLKCGKCEKAFTGKYVIAAEKPYHSECFVCSKEGCGKALEASYTVKHGVFFCGEECSGDVKTEAGSTEPHESDPAVPPEICPGCEGDCQPGQKQIKALEGVWHVGCFKCQAPGCGKDLGAGDFLHAGNKPYCNEKCVSSAPGSTVAVLVGADGTHASGTCAKCNEDAGEERCIEAMGKVFHERCWGCFAPGCNKKFTEQILKCEGLPYCSDECVQKAVGATSTA